MKRNPLFDVLRGLAVLGVILRHASNTYFPTAGIVGVGIFFTLSGFLITGLLQNHARNTGRIDWKIFFWNRLVRLAPALLLLVLAWSLLTLTIDPLGERPLFAKTVVIALTYTANIGMHIAGSMGHLWTLSTEEQFYLLWPFIIFALGRTKKVVITVGAILLGELLVLYILTLLLSPSGHVSALYSFGPSWFQAILVGCLGSLLKGKVSSLVQLRQLSAVANVILFALCFVPINEDNPFTYLVEIPVISLSAVLTIISWSMGDGDSIPKYLDPMRYMGMISYGAYLWNLPLTELAQQKLSGAISPVISILGTILAAALSWHLLEKPLKKFHKKYQVSLPTQM